MVTYEQGIEEAIGGGGGIGTIHEEEADADPYGPPVLTDDKTTLSARQDQADDELISVDMASACDDDEEARDYYSSSMDKQEQATATDDDEQEEGKQQPTSTSLRHRLADSTRKWLAPIWADRRIGLALASLAAAVWGVLAGFWMPRGPLTTGQAMGSIWISWIVFGACNGLVTRSFWTLLAAPVSFQFFLELMRLRVDGPSVDKPHFTTYGTIAFVSGRGVHFLVSVVPMMVGIAVGVTAARNISNKNNREEEDETRRKHRRQWARYLGYAVMGLCVVGVLALVIALLIPARTESINNNSSEDSSIAQLTSIRVNGHDLALMIRGRSVKNPVLLFLAGGPGGSELGAMRNHLQELEHYFVVVTWDQRGCGKSYVELDPLDTVTPEGYIDDTLDVTDYLRDRFGRDTIYLMGQSWGSLLGVLSILESPEKYTAYIGTGQMVDVLATDRIMYNDTLAWARSTGRQGLVGDLLANGPPPYVSSVYPYELIASHESDVYPYDHSVNSEGEGGFSENLNVKEYNLIQRLHLLAAFLDTYAAVYPQIQDYNLRNDEGGTMLAVPVFFVQGLYEARGRSEIFEEWYPSITAPMRDLVVLNTSGHRPLFEQPHEFVQYMVNTVLASTTPRRK